MITYLVQQCLKVSLCTFGLFQGTAAIAFAETNSLGNRATPIFLAQVTPDNTVNTQVNQNGNVSEITGGETRGENLFHSFGDFSVQTGNEAFFNNATDVGNIFSRVTGGNVSNINGLIRANGGANLFLINPAGVIFGAGGSLDIGGSFYGSSASSVLFEDGEFSAADLDNPPLLTVNAPIGLNFRDNPGEIAVRGTSLNVAPGQSLNLIGGEVNIDGGRLNPLGGTVNLGAVSGVGTVTIDENSNLGFNNLPLADISLNNDARVNVSGNGGGEITVNARNLTLSEASILNAGINSENSTAQTQAGDININTTETLFLESGSLIGNTLNSSSLGNSGNINVDTASLNLTEGSSIFTNTGGEGNAGSLNITAGDRISLAGSNFQANVLSGAVGNAGDINITTNSLLLTSDTQNSPSFITAETGGEGNAGNITVNTVDLALNNSSIFITRVQPQALGNAGNIEISTENLSLTGGTGNAPTALIANTQGVGNGGNVTVNATGNITTSESGSILSQVIQGAEGNGGNINVTANSLNASELQLIANTRSQGNAGSVTLDIAEEIQLDRGSLIASQVRSESMEVEGVGEAGDINITTGSLESNNSLIVADSSGIGSSGDINITADNTITLQGLPTVENELDVNIADGNLPPSQIITGLDEFINPNTGVVESSGQGEAGNINITAGQLNLNDLASISSNVEETTVGGGGEVTLNVGSLNIANNAAVSTFTVNASDAGSITINSENVDLLSGGRIVSATDGGGNAGTINLNISDRLNIDNANAENAPRLVFNNAITNELLGRTGLFANATEDATGNAGSIAIGQNPNLGISQEITIANGAEVRVDSAEQGNAGSIAISTDSLSLNNGLILAENAAGRGGNINLTAGDRLTLRNGSRVSSAAINFASGGNVTIDTDFVIAFPSNNDILARAERGEGGNISITADSVLGIKEGAENDLTNDIDASSDVIGFDGTVTIDTPDVDPAEEATEVPTNVIEPKEIAAQACNANIVKTEENSLTVEGKGGIPTIPEAPIDSENIIVQGQMFDATGTSAEPQTVNTSYGTITPARGVKVTKNGVFLTAYRTEPSDRIPHKSRNCR